MGKGGPFSYSITLCGKATEHPAAAILLSHPRRVVSWSLFVPGLKAAVTGLRYPFGDSRGGHRTFRLISGCLGATWVSVTPRMGREEREPHREAATAIAPSHAPLIQDC
ncbi:hypothetical protein NDU88_004687 [Pleurodeles waltl]|uniref:Uncharacterized protein n=1 Tax=Pleurodeles waltl TaxID=8319 RepID=A0AAV7NKH8_PLEWA|nr:hypothetical protein NDU88_004687 [Pleurodeles waltl]